jgi:3-deoxy-7-phosphoheptulonate synthase
MAMRIKDKTGLSIVFDPSHTGGSVSNVIKITQEAAEHNFNGLIVEVHHDPKNALTDAKQQLTWEEFDKLYEKNYS